MARRMWHATTVLILMTTLTSCQSGGSATRGQARSSPGPPALAELKVATYTGIEEGQGPVTLSGGAWEGAPYVAGGASRPSVRLVEDLLLAGDMTGDGTADAVALLTATTGGAGEISYLALMNRRDGRVVNLATATLGDRVQIRAARVENGELVVDVVQSGPNDPKCCPGDLATRRWRYAGGRLQESAPVIAGRLSPAALAGHEWVLTRWSWDTAAPADPPVTLRLAESRVSGNAGCNQYFAAVKAGDSPSDIRIGPAAATRMMCAEAAMAVEDRFMAQLQAVRSFSFVAGRLVLSYEKDGNFLSMVFATRDSR